MNTSPQLLKRFFEFLRNTGAELFKGPEIIHVEGYSGIDQTLEVVGTHHYQKNLYRICEGYSDEKRRILKKAVLFHENQNAYDNKAIRVSIDNRTVGYLSREDARLYRNKLKRLGYEGIIISCGCDVIGGWRRKGKKTSQFHVYLHLQLKDL